MSKQPTFLGGLIVSVIPLAVAVAVLAVFGLLAYLFWFGFEALF
jgi:hypothetical protein